MTKILARSLRIIIFLILISNYISSADDVLLVDGYAWLNVNILEKSETKYTITLYTTDQKKIIINKKDVEAISFGKFNTLKPSSFIKLNKEQRLELNFFSEDKYGNIETDDNLNLDTLLYDLPNLRFWLDAGYSYRFLDISGDMPQYMREYVSGLKKGYNYTFGLTYFLGHNYGISITFSQFFASNSISNIKYKSSFTEEPSIGSIEDNITISFIGSGISIREAINRNYLIFVCTVALGKISFNNDGRAIDQYFDIEGTAFGMNGIFGLEYAFNQRISLGIDISGLAGTMRTIKINGQKFDESENIKRLDLNLGFRYNF